MQSKEKEYGVILNPYAGHGYAERAKEQIVNYFEKKRIAVHLELTKYAGHARSIAKRMKKDFKVIIAAGGDGTINEVLSGIIGSKTTLGFLPIGSGNDLNKTIGIPEKIHDALDAILHNNTTLVDVGKVTFLNNKGETKSEFFINTFGCGLDAEIANETKKIGIFRGLPLYIIAAIKALRKHVSNNYKISLENNEELQLKAFLVCVGNGKFEGGGFKLLPKANIYDSKLDVCIITAMPIIKALRIVPDLIRGAHRTYKNVFYIQSEKLRIKSSIPFIIHGDGEIFGTDVLQATIELAKEKIRMSAYNPL